MIRFLWAQGMMAASVCGTDVNIYGMDGSVDTVFTDQPFKWHSGRTSAVTTDGVVAYVDGVALKG
jgi:hypothetical protein